VQFPRSILVEHLRHARCPRDEDATRKLLTLNLSLISTQYGRCDKMPQHKRAVADEFRLQEVSCRSRRRLWREEKEKKTEPVRLPPPTDLPASLHLSTLTLVRSSSTTRHRLSTIHIARNPHVVSIDDWPSIVSYRDSPAAASVLYIYRHDNVTILGLK